MGNVQGKTSSSNEYGLMLPPSTPTHNDAEDPRSPSLKRTPLPDHNENWRHKAILAAAAAREDPRSPSTLNRTPLAHPPNIMDREDPRSPSMLNRTPVCTPPPNLMGGEFTTPVASLTLSYDTCTKINPEDPRSPLFFRTPLNQATGITQYDTSAVTCGPLADDTIIINNAANISQDLDITLSASSTLINNPLAGMSIISTSTEALDKDEEKQPLAKSDMEDIQVPSSPLGASACRVEQEEGEKKVKLVEHVGSPSVPSDRKRKKAPTQNGGNSPLKKSFPCSPSMNSDNNDNFENIENASPIIAPRRVPHSPTQAKGASSPTLGKRALASGHARRPSNLKNSTAGGSPRSPLSPIVPHRSKLEVSTLAI